jgi:putative endonuclease
MFHYVYILRSIQFKKLYIGYTSRKLNVRLEEHNSGKTFFTSQYTPWKLIYFEGYLTEKQARAREKMLKQYGSSWQKLKKRIMD